MAAGYSQGLFFIPGAKVGQVPVYDAFLKNYFQALLDKGGGRGDREGGGVYRALKRHEHI